MLRTQCTPGTATTTMATHCVWSSHTDRVQVVVVGVAAWEVVGAVEDEAEAVPPPDGQITECLCQVCVKY